jgi:hypothetical protein
MRLGGAWARAGAILEAYHASQKNRSLSGIPIVKSQADLSGFGGAFSWNGAFAGENDALRNVAFSVSYEALEGGKELNETYDVKGLEMHLRKLFPLNKGWSVSVDGGYRYQNEGGMNPRTSKEPSVTVGINYQR